MKQSALQHVVIIGCGNVAWHLAKQFKSLKKYRVTVYNHKTNPLLTEFKSKLKCDTEVGLKKVEPNADYYFVCVTDKFIGSVCKKLNIRNPKALLMHTSGSAELSVLGSGVYNKGVFYPLQSFSRHSDVNWKEIPIILEASTADGNERMTRLATAFSLSFFSLNYKERLRLHMAAVWVNNFTNAMYVVASDLLLKTNLKKEFDFELLMPLIWQTTQKVSKLNPRAAQTGPAKRRDGLVMKKHLALLSKQKELKKLYKQLSHLIATQQC